ncbi:MAG: polysaccharide deacetylase family protein [Acidimicrobiales bacterium]
MGTRHAGADRAGRVVGLASAALAAQYLPSTVTLGQWTSLQVLPWDLCRWQGPAGRPAVALTFDDGPSPEATPAVLDRLDELGLRATFFPLGSLAEREPDLVAEVVRRGHQVGVHGYHHRHHLARSPAWVWRDLARADRAMEAVGVRPTWYRPSYGQATGSTLAAARRRGWRTVLWSAWGREWTTTDPDEVAGRIAGRLRPGAVVLLHDNDAFGRDGMWRVGLEALDGVARELARRELRAVTLDELVA